MWHIFTDGFRQGYFMKSIIEQASSIMKAIEKAWGQAEQPKEFSIKIFEKEERNFFGMTTKPAKIGIFFGDKPIIHEKPAQKPRPEIKECRPSVAPSSSKSSGGHGIASDSAKASGFPKATSDATADRMADKPTIKPTEKQIEKSENKISPKAQEPSRPAQQQTTPKPARPIEPQASRATAPVKQVQTRQQPVVEKKPLPTTPKEEKAPRMPAAWNETMVTSAHNWLKRTLDLMNMGNHQFNSEIAGKNLKLTFHAPLITDVAHEKQLFRSFAHLIMSSLRNQYKQEIRDLKVILIRPE